MATQPDSIQYAYAFDEEGDLAHISEAVRSIAYTCPACKNPLTPVLGEVKAKHFRHLNVCCSIETYLHRCAKEAFFHHYTRSIKSGTPISLVLERTVRCDGPRLGLIGVEGVACKKNLPASYNLLRLFDKADLEVRHGRTGMQPDILLSHSSAERCCYIEICVTHPCTQEKIDSGIPILEFKISSASDIQMLLNGTYLISDERVNAYNWRPPPKTVNVCSEICAVGDVDMSVWSLSPAGRMCERRVILSEVDLATDSPVNAWPSEIGSDDTHNRLRAFLRHADPHSQFPNCLMCVKGSKYDAGYVHCNQKAKRVPYFEARQCAAYKEAGA